MKHLSLVCKETSDYYPKAIVSLYDFLRRRTAATNLWPFVADFMREIMVTDPIEIRERRFDELATQYLLRNETARNTFKQLLFQVYELSLPEDPRGRFLEYVVYATIPYCAVPTGKSQVAYECALHEIDGDSSVPVVWSEATFDAGYLSETCFEGHECKINVWNFLSEKEQLSEAAARKLRFMTSTGDIVKERGGSSYLFLVGLRRPSLEPKFLSRAAFEGISILGPDDIGLQIIA